MRVENDTMVVWTILERINRKACPKDESDVNSCRYDSSANSDGFDVLICCGFLPYLGGFEPQVYLQDHPSLDYGH